MSDFVSTITSGAVQGAYRKSQDLSGVSEALPTEGGEASFASMIEGAAQDAVASLREAERTTQAGLAGEASTQSMVEAAIALESTVKMAVVVRDKLVSAYQEVMRMPI